MKIQCSCGAKYVFEVTPEMLEKPVRFVCSSCGLDASEYVNNLVRQEFAPEAIAPGAHDSDRASSPDGIVPGEQTNPPRDEGSESFPPAAGGAGPGAKGPVVRIVGQASRLPMGRLALETKHTGETPVTEGGTPAPLPVPLSETCAKHYGVPTTGRCYVCSKPICPKCMALFGYVCSPLCKAKADSHGINLPVYEGQKSRIEARRSRNLGRIAAATFVLLAGLAGLWVWYLFWGSLPKPVWSVRFPEMSYSGQSAFGEKDQIVFLHGDTLARYDIKLSKEIWSRRLADQKQIEAGVAETLKWYQAEVERANTEGDEKSLKIPSRDKLAKSAERAAAAQLALRVRGRNVWVSAPGKLVRYDWDTGNPIKEIPLASSFGGLIPRGDELLMVETESGRPVITHINLTNCETRTEEIGGPAVAHAATANDNPEARPPPGSTGSGRPVSAPGKGSGKGLDPAKVAEQAQHLSYPARIALPAVLSVQLNQERALAEMNDKPKRPSSPPALPPELEESSSLIPTVDGLMQVSVRLIESRITQRSAMKAAPAKSALDGAVTVAKTTDIANEILNDMQRERGGDVVTEDNSRYQVTIRRPGEKDGWSGEVTGPPAFFPLQTVNVLAANKSILVFDKSNKLMWKGPLNYNVSGDLSSLDAANALYGQGPCVEHKNGLYVFDEGVLTAFDLATGNARWRLPSVGVVGLFFDDQDMMYVNTTTAGPDSLKYSRQIDVSQKTSSVVLKLDSKTGKTLWSAELNGLINYVSGKFIFTVKMYQPDEPDEEDAYSPQTGSDTPAFLRIKRIDPRTGREMWEHFQQRAPLDIQFDKNTIRLVFKKEVQVLRFLSL